MEKEAHQKDTVRLNRFLSMAGVCSRREADRLIEQGRVTVDGETGQAGMQVGKDQAVCLDGKRLHTDSKPVILAVNKPVGVVCTTDRKWGDTLLEDIVDYPVRVFGIGRLDKNSEGLILMTNRGDLPNRIMRARNFHEKEYEVTIDRPADRDFLEKMRKGVFLPELQVTTRPCTVVRTGECSFRIILTQGLNRQIRRMCMELGRKVVSLRRTRIMNITLGELPAGAYRELTRHEILQLAKDLGMRPEELTG